MQIESTTKAYQDIDTQALVIPVFKDEKTDQGFLKSVDAATGGIVKSVIESEELKGKEGETVYLHLLNNDQIKAQRLLLVGVGEQSDYTRTQVSQMAGTAIRLLRGKSVKSLAIVPRLEAGADDIASAVVEGSVMATFDPDKYRTVDKEDRTIERLVVASEGADE